MKKLLLTLALITSAAQAETVRNPAVVRQFHRTHICPSTGYASMHCKGYVVDHIMPLACGGADAVENMQYQSIPEGKAKDRWEIKGNAKHKPCSGDAK